MPWDMHAEGSHERWGMALDQRNAPATSPRGKHARVGAPYLPAEDSTVPTPEHVGIAGLPAVIVGSGSPGEDSDNDSLMSMSPEEAAAEISELAGLDLPDSGDARPETVE